MLSSASLFHFTRDLTSLERIITEGFKPFYSPENLEELGVPGCPGIPMVSFCDIPLSKTVQHTSEYGSYALGFTKEWGMTHNISPIHYIYPGSMCATVIKTIYENIPTESILRACTCFTFSPETAIFFYAKPYEGLSHKTARPVRFYDEREWRYVPFADPSVALNDSNVQPILSAAEMNDEETRATKTKALHTICRLRFTADDIRYVVVRSEEEVPEIVDTVNQLHCTPNEKKRLAARVLAIERIWADF